MNGKEFRRLVGDLARAEESVVPRCPHAGDCGGCAFQDRAYAGQLAAKRAALLRVYGESGLPNIAQHLESFELVGSPDPYNYRSRMDYVATKGRFGLRARGKFNYIVELETCHLIPPAAFAAAKAVWLRAGELGLPDYNIRSHEGFLRYIVVRRAPDDAVMLAAVTAAEPYDAAMEELAATALAQAEVVSFHWLLNDSLTDLSFGSPLRHWGLETLAMGGSGLVIGPNSFFQNNLHLLDRLLADLGAAVTAGRELPFVADLYGGVGTIALHLAPQVAQVVSVEAVAESAALAERNFTTAGVSNAQAVGQDVLHYLRGQAPGAFEVVVADPPRIGLGPEVCAELLRTAPQRIVYLSCNPLTQVEDLRALAAGYELRALRGYDMFPHTPHVEAMAVLEAK